LMRNILRDRKKTKIHKNIFRGDRKIKIVKKYKTVKLQGNKKKIINI